MREPARTVRWCGVRGQVCARVTNTVRQVRACVCGGNPPVCKRRCVRVVRSVEKCNVCVRW